MSIDRTSSPIKPQSGGTGSVNEKNAAEGKNQATGATVVPQPSVDLQSGFMPEAGRSAQTSGYDNELQSAPKPLPEMTCAQSGAGASAGGSASESSLPQQKASFVGYSNQIIADPDLAYAVRPQQQEFEGGASGGGNNNLQANNNSNAGGGPQTPAPATLRSRTNEVFDLLYPPFLQEIQTLAEQGNREVFEPVRPHYMTPLEIGRPVKEHRAATLERLKSRTSADDSQILDSFYGAFAAEFLDSLPQIVEETNSRLQSPELSRLGESFKLTVIFVCNDILSCGVLPRVEDRVAAVVDAVSLAMRNLYEATLGKHIHPLGRDLPICEKLARIDSSVLRRRMPQSLQDLVQTINQLRPSHLPPFEIPLTLWVSQGAEMTDAGAPFAQIMADSSNPRRAAAVCALSAQIVNRFNLSLFNYDRSVLESVVTSFVSLAEHIVDMDERQAPHRYTAAGENNNARRNG